MSIERRRLMLAYGASFDLTPREKGMKGAIERARQLVEEIPGAWIPQRFENPANVAVHVRTTAEEILADFADTPIDVLITGVGTGGHLTGCAERLKQTWPGLKAWAVEPALSPVISGGQPAHPRSGDRRGLHSRQSPHSVDRRRDPGRCGRCQGLGASLRHDRRPARRDQLGRDAGCHCPEAARASGWKPPARLQLRHRRTLSVGAGLPAGIGAVSLERITYTDDATALTGWLARPVDASARSDHPLSGS
jgi:hypothetical protein